MEKKLPEFKPLPELGNVTSNYMSAFNVGMNIYEALAYLQGYVQITYNSVNDLIDDWNNFETYVTENIQTIANEKTQEILNQWLEDGTLNELIATNPQWALKVNKAGDVMSGDLQFQENTGVYGTLHSGDKVNIISHTYTGTDDYTQVGDSNAQTVVRSKDRPVWYDGSQNQDLLVEEDLTPQPNLLDNADFKSGIINQRGQTVYDFSSSESRQYGIDRWALTALKLTVNDGYIKIENTKEKSHSFVQYFDYAFNEKCTWYVNIKNASEGVYLWCGKTIEDVDYHKIGDLGRGDNIFQYGGTEETFCSFGISVPAGGSVEIVQCKLEQGDLFTGMPVWSEPLELIKCQQKLIKLNRNFSGYGIGDYIYTIYDSLLENENVPSIVLNGTKTMHLFYDGNVHDYDISTREITGNPNGYIRINGFSSWNNYTLNGYFDCDIFADYEIY